MRKRIWRKMCFAKSTVDNCQPDSSIIGISRFENFNYPSLKDHAENSFINFPRGGRELATAKELGFCTVIPVISLRSTDARERALANGTSPDYALRTRVTSLELLPNWVTWIALKRDSSEELKGKIWRLVC